MSFFVRADMMSNRLAIQKRPCHSAHGAPQWHGLAIASAIMAPNQLKKWMSRLQGKCEHAFVNKTFSNKHTVHLQSSGCVYPPKQRFCGTSIYFSWRNYVIFLGSSNNESRVNHKRTNPATNKYCIIWAGGPNGDQNKWEYTFRNGQQVANLLMRGYQKQNAWTKPPPIILELTSINSL